MTEIILGLGTNLGDREHNLKEAVRLIGLELLNNIEQSSIYHSEPLLLPNSPPEWNLPFINIVIAGQLKNESTTPSDFLTAVKNIETKLGRTPAARWSPRIIDIDILLWGKKMINLPDLNIPHLEMHSRDFVMKPLLEIRPDWQPGKRKES